MASEMRTLITGKGGKSGSWQIRGVQIGEAIGADVQPMAEASDCRSADAVIAVKRIPGRMLRNLRAGGKPWVWDVVDAYPQPTSNAWSKDRACQWLHDEIARLQPDGIIFPTKQMQADAEFSGPSWVIPHHAWAKYKPAMVLQNVMTVGYEGAEAYIANWRRHIEAACAVRGWRFVVNGDMGSCQIGIALRDAQGHPARHWKSNCKLANLQALGIPAICSPSSAYVEFGSGEECYATEPAMLNLYFDALADMEVRKVIAAKAIASAPRIYKVAEQYRQCVKEMTGRDPEL